jgi:hypothetical protein
MDLIYFHGFLFQIFDDIDIYYLGTKLSIYDRRSSVEGLWPPHGKGDGENDDSVIVAKKLILVHLTN